MLIENSRFIRLTNNSIMYEDRNGKPEYIPVDKIVRIQDMIRVNGKIDGSYVYLAGGYDKPVPVKESPGFIIGLINDGDYCNSTNQQQVVKVPYPG